MIRRVRVCRSFCQRTRFCNAAFAQKSYLQAVFQITALPANNHKLRLAERKGGWNDWGGDHIGEDGLNASLPGPCGRYPPEAKETRSGV